MPRRKNKALEKPDRRDNPFFRYGDGFWMIDTFVTVDGLPKRLHIKKRWFSTKAEAQAAYDDLVNEAIQKETKKNNKNAPTFDDLKEMYLAERCTEIRPGSVKSKELPFLRRFFSQYDGMKVADIFTQKEARKFRSELVLAKNQFGNPYCVADLNRVVALYDRLLDFACENRYISKDDHYYCKLTMKRVKKPIQKETGRERPSYAANDEELETILEALPEDLVDGCLFRFLLWTGFRIGEALALTPSEIDFEAGKIKKYWNWTIDETGRYSRVRGTKNNTEGDYIVSDKVLRLLRDHIYRYKIKAHEYLFFSPLGRDRPVEQSAYRKRIKKLCAALGVRYVRPHIERHTFCTRLSAITTGSNMDRKAIESVTGHTFDTDQEIYNHADEARVRELVNKA